MRESKVLKRGIALLISEANTEDKGSEIILSRSNKYSSNREHSRSDLQLKIEQSTVRCSLENINRACVYSDKGPHKKHNIDWDLTGLTLGQVREINNRCKEQKEG